MYPSEASCPAGSASIKERSSRRMQGIPPAHRRDNLLGSKPNPPRWERIRQGEVAPPDAGDPARCTAGTICSSVNPNQPPLGAHPPGRGCAAGCRGFRPPHRQADLLGCSPDRARREGASSPAAASPGRQERPADADLSFRRSAGTTCSIGFRSARRFSPCRQLLRPAPRLAWQGGRGNAVAPSRRCGLAVPPRACHVPPARRAQRL